MARRSSSAVRSQMPSGRVPSLEGSPGRYRSSEPPFDRPQDTGTGGIPVKMYEDMGQKGPKSTMTKATPGNQGAFSTGSNNNDYKNERPVQRMPPPKGRR